MSEILYGKEIANAMKEELAGAAEALSKREITPTLAIVRIGARGDDIAYERSALKYCDATGIRVAKFELDEDTSEFTLLKEIDRINRDDSIHGCLMFRPLPKGINEDRVCNTLMPRKDVDGITDNSLAYVFSGKGQGYAPCTAQACMKLLDYYGYDLAGQHTVVVGRSLVIGKPVAMMAMAANATVTICHSKTKNLAEQCRSADVLIVAMGRAGLVDKEFINPDGIVLDVGINVDEEGNLCGDVRREDAELAKAYSPVPGGIGAVTISMLASNVIDAAKKSSK